MAEHFENRVLRPIRVYLEHLTVDGLLDVYLGWRTQDELNAAGKPTLTLHSPTVVAGDWEMGEGPLVINKASILFVTEIPDIGASMGKVRDTSRRGRFDYSAIRLSLGSFCADGYVYTSHGVDAMGRLSQASHTFVALTAAALTGPGADVVLPFIAVNRLRVVVAQELFDVSTVEEDDATPGMISS